MACGARGVLLDCCAPSGGALAGQLLGISFGADSGNGISAGLGSMMLFLLG